MSIEYRKQDLFELADSRQVKAIGHGVNIMGAMGAGIALEFKRRYPAMFSEYQRWCKRQRDACEKHPGLEYMGSVFSYPTKGIVICNIVIKEHWRDDAELSAVEKGITHALWDAECRWGSEASVAIPMIGAGLGRLSRDDVKSAFEKAVSSRPNVKLIVCEK